MNKNPYKIRISDFVLMAVIIVCSVLFYFLLNSIHKNEKGNQVVITISGSEYGRYNLNENQTIEIKSDNGINKIKIENGSVSVDYANCPDKFCVKNKAISKSGETIICLPNKLTIEIVGDKNSSDIDVVVK